jgi:diketogulonate reductase-like aldo/keto reductase
VSVAAAHNVSAAQVALRWIAQQDIPFAVSPGLNEQYAVSLTPAQQSKGYQTQIGFIC